MPNYVKPKAKKKPNYKLIIDHRKEEFENLVNEALEDGWELAGGPSTNQNLFLQGVTKKINKTT